MILLFGALKILMVWIPLLAICLRLLPVTGPGRLPFCIGLSGIWSLFLTAALMWSSLVLTGMILHWLPFGIMATVALMVLWWAPPRLSVPVAASSWQPLGRLARWVTIVLTALIVVRLVSLLPDVALRPLLGWDAAVVWAYEARVWFEAGRYVEFLPPEEWLAAPAEAWVRMTAVEYPRLIPALILWIAMAENEWGGVGPGLLWWSAVVFVTTMLFGIFRLFGLSLPWALAGAYLWSSLPMISAHVALYGYADLWMACAFASFAAGVLLATRSNGWVWWLLALSSLMIMPLIKVEGSYWLLVGAFAILLGWFWPGVRWLVLITALGVASIWFTQLLGWDLLQLATQGRLSFNAGGWSRSISGGMRHAFLWYDWHLLFYVFIVAIALALYRPGLVQPHPALTGTAVLAFTMLWGLAPLTEAGSWFSNGTLFSRIGLHVSPLLAVFSTLIIYRFWAQDSHAK